VGLSRSVLVAEDNAVLQSVLRAMLTWWGFVPVLATDGAEAWRILQSADSPRLAIIDWLMPGMDGIELCRRVRASQKGAYTYMMLLTARANSADVVAGLNAGADDYLTKPFNAHELRARLRTGSRILELQGELLAAREALQSVETRDGLTGVLNRAAIVQALERELAAGGRCAILLADLDRLRHINSSFGQAAGDAVLVEWASRLGAAAPPPAIVGRYASDEFVVVLPGCAPAANDCADRIRAAAARQPFTFGAAAFPATCTVVAANWRQGDAAALLREAEEALAVAKRENRERLAETLLNRSTAMGRSVAGLPKSRSASQTG
jgi:two-component system, cell cycle response regulator